MRVRFLPSLPDLVFVAMLFWLFAAGTGWSVLLADGDTGWHIRNGEAILDCRCIPRHDSFAFGSGQREWFSWEWLSDVAFGLLHRAGGLKAVTLFSGVAIAAAWSIVFRHMLWRGAGALVSLAVLMFAAGASSIHFLARPHILSLLLGAGTAWVLDRDRTVYSRWIWFLPGVVAFWTNLHGGFLLVFPLLAARVFESALDPVGRSKKVWRALALSGGCAMATLANPYGWRLHRHLFEYLRSTWIRTYIQEFQSPRFGSESMLQFEVLLALGLAMIPVLWRARRYFETAVIIFWAHEALVSARHVTIYCLLAAPFIASGLESLFRRWISARPPDSFASGLGAINLDWSRLTAGISSFPAAFVVFLVTAPGAGSWPNDFPENKFPVAITSRNRVLLGGSPGHPVRAFSSDQWSDYLIYHLHPQLQTFFDGRSDFLGPWRGNDYSLLMEGKQKGLIVLDREKVEFALVPHDWALSGLLAQDHGWEKVDSDTQAVLFRRKPAGGNLALKK